MDIKKSSFDDVLIKSSHFSQDGKRFWRRLSKKIYDIYF